MLLTYFSTLGGVSALNVVVTEMINSAFGIKAGWLKQLISWVCPMLLSILGFVFSFGIFSAYGTISSVSGWIYTVLTGLGLGLTSNGIYDIEFVQNIIKTLKNLLLLQKSTNKIIKEN